MKKIMFVTILSLLSACGGKGGGGTKHDNNVVSGPGAGNGTGSDYVRFTVNPQNPIRLCSRGAFTIASGGVADVDSLSAYLQDYLMNADRLYNQIGYVSHKNEHGESIPGYYVTGEQVATMGSSSGYP